MILYNYTTSSIFQVILFFASFCHYPNLQIVSNIFLKSINVQNSIFPTDKYISIYTCKQNMLTIVWIPAWTFGVIAAISAYLESPNDHHCQVWFSLVEQFCRRIKCENLMGDRHQVMVKTHLALAW